jgi:site-specific DNA-methyltransferase (adenine-specific)
MLVEMRSIELIKPYENNPRINDAAVDAVAASLREFGFRQPCVVDEAGVIIVGHTRYKAALKLGLSEVPVHVAVGLSPAQARAYRIADNQTATLSAWDDAKLPLELIELQKLDFDLGLTGFGDDDLQRLLAPPGTEGLTDPDDVPEAPEEPVTKPGDVWKLGRHRLICGDSTNPETIRRLLAGQTARMMFTDPPWNVAIGQDANPRHRQREGLANDDLPAADFRALLDGFLASAATHVTGDVYCVLGASEWPTLDAAMRQAGYHWSATIVWVKDMFVLGRSKYHRRYEPIWYGWRDGGSSSFNGRRDLDDVWEIPRPKRSEEHPTMKPVELVQRAVEASSQPGDGVLDPFGGAGSTLIAAEQTGRTAYLAELEPRFVDVIVQRFETFSGAKAEREAE